MEYHNFLLKEYFHSETIDINHAIDEILTKYEQVASFIIDTDEYINNLCKSGGVVFEGAQGTMLDMNHGTYHI